MKVGKAKMGFKGRKELDGCFHRKGHGNSVNKVRRHKKTVETRVRQQGRKACRL